MLKICAERVGYRNWGILNDEWWVTKIEWGVISDLKKKKNQTAPYVLSKATFFIVSNFLIVVLTSYFLLTLTLSLTKVCFLLSELNSKSSERIDNGKWSWSRLPKLKRAGTSTTTVLWQKVQAQDAFACYNHQSPYHIHLHYSFLLLLIYLSPAPLSCTTLTPPNLILLPVTL